MCYSAMVEQRYKAWERFRARHTEKAFEELFQRRVGDDSVKVAKALEANYAEPRTPSELRVKGYIEAYHERVAREHQTALFAQRKRLADAERKLKAKETKKALEEKRIATSKVAWHLEKLADLTRTEPMPDDARIFPFWYAPVAVMEEGEIVVRPMRYHCRPNGKPASIDRSHDGLYNARRDSLEGFWGPLFGRRHAVVMVTSFFENVARHDFEKRALRPDEKAQNLVLHFKPRMAAPMLLACVYDCWRRPGERDLYSFAAITDDPPPEIAAVGHERCVIPLKESNVQAWLAPEGREKAELYGILDDRERPYYEHAVAA